MPAVIQNTLHIRCSPEALYNYVTQPWLWHEWHPNSKAARSLVSELKAGDSFEEEIEIQPAPPIPLKMKRHTVYKVETAQKYSLWEVKGNMNDGWLSIRYEFTADKAGTEFSRTLTFEAKGLSRLLMPVLKKSMTRQSLKALSNLKNKLENA